MLEKSENPLMREKGRGRAHARTRARVFPLYSYFSLFFILYNDVLAGLREGFGKASGRLREGFGKASGRLLSLREGF
jgi:hypothetical protein